MKIWSIQAHAASATPFEERKGFAVTVRRRATGQAICRSACVTDMGAYPVFSADPVVGGNWIDVEREDDLLFEVEGVEEATILVNGKPHLVRGTSDESSKLLP